MSRHGRSMRSRESVTHNIQAPDLRRRTAAQHAGTRVARAQSVDERIVTMPVFEKRAIAQARLPADVRQQLLDAIYAGHPFRGALRDLALTSNQVWGLTKTDEEWSTALEAALMATRQHDLEHGTNAAYVAGCVCKECRVHQRERMAKNRRTG
jgi:hypothetical protein